MYKKVIILGLLIFVIISVGACAAGERHPGSGHQAEAGGISSDEQAGRSGEVADIKYQNESKKDYTDEKLSEDTVNTVDMVDTTNATGREVWHHEMGYHELIPGFWHYTVPFPAGFAFRYYFREDGTFIFLNTSMNIDEDCARYVGHNGYWEILEDILIITATEETIIKGGEVAEHVIGLVAIEGGTQATLPIHPPRIIENTINVIELGYHHHSVAFGMTIGDSVFWKYEGFPEYAIYY